MIADAPAVGTEAGSARFRIWLTPLVIVAVTLAVMLPEMLIGPSTSDSLRFNIVWTDQWRTQFGWADLYPRWLASSWQGYGSPTFYFYPPLFFWIAGLADGLSLGTLETGTLLSATSAIVLAFSGLTMAGWLRAHVGSGAALFGAVIYMLTPYHLYDIYARAALAESSAYAVLPLVLLGVMRVGRSDTGGVVLLAVSYAALVCAHLPVALLTSVTLIPAYALWTLRASSWRRGIIGNMLLGGVLGLSLAALYLLPALLLLPNILAEALSGRYFTPQSWFFLDSESWADPGVMTLVMICWFAAAATIGLAALARPRSVEAMFWCAMGSVLLLLVAGIPAAFWQLPAISQIQFPWRALILVDVAAVTAIMIAQPRPRLAVAALIAVPVALAWALVVTSSEARLRATIGASGADLAVIRANYADAPEYLPAGSVLPLDENGLPNPAVTSIPRQRALVAGQGVLASAEATAEGGIAATVRSIAPATITARRFVFPRWQVLDGRGRAVPLVATPERLVAWRVPAGTSTWRMIAVPTAPERLGAAISAMALALLIGGLIVPFATRLRRRTALRRPA